MKFPSWLPFPSSWLRAFGLAFPTFFGAIIFLLEFWRFLFFAFLSIKQPSDFRTCMFIAVIFLGLGVLTYLFFVLVEFWLAGSVRKSQTWVKWFFPYRGFWGLSYGFIVTALASLASAILFLPAFLAFFRSEMIVESLRQWSQSGEYFEVIKRLFIPWWIAAAYLYQAEFLARQWLSVKRKSRPRNGKPSPVEPTPIDPVEAELERMRQQMKNDRPPHQG